MFTVSYGFRNPLKVTTNFPYPLKATTNFSKSVEGRNGLIIIDHNKSQYNNHINVHSQLNIHGNENMQRKIK